MKRIILIPLLLVVYACSDEVPVAAVAPNILLIIGDDMGVETLTSYGLGENPAKTATLDQLARDGVQFTNFWSQPVCSPTRATMLTGRYAFRTGVGRPGGEGDNTYIIFMGDNGTDRSSVSAPFRPTGAKGSVYQGGVNVPLIVSGPGVAEGASSSVLVNSTDMFSTIIEMAGISVDDVLPEGVTIDSVSFLPYLSSPDAESRREWLYADYFDHNFDGVANANYAMRNQRYKLLRTNGVEEFYDLGEDPYEHNNLLAGELTANEQAEYEGLQQQLLELRANND